MGYEKYPRGDFYGRRDTHDDDRDYNSARDDNYSRPRDYGAGSFAERDRSNWEGGREQGLDQGRDRSSQRDFGNYGQREYGHGGYSGYAPRNQQGGYGRQFGSRDSQSTQGYDNYRDRYGADDRPRGQRFEGGQYGAGRYGAASYGGRQDGPGGDPRFQGQRGAPQGYDEDDRGFFARAGDEVRSWFGDEEAERRREADMRYDEQAYNDRDADYGNWRRSQIAALDRDYDEYRNENRSKFENEFATWRSGRQTQRDSLTKVEEHMDVVGSDGSHVGTVDKVRGDRILLTKNDTEAEGRHHSIPSSWINTVDTKVTLSKSADEAKKHWRDEERNQAMFGDTPRTTADRPDNQGRMLNRSFSGTY